MTNNLSQFNLSMPSRSLLVDKYTVCSPRIVMATTVRYVTLSKGKDDLSFADRVAGLLDDGQK